MVLLAARVRSVNRRGSLPNAPRTSAPRFWNYQSTLGCAPSALARSGSYPEKPEAFMELDIFARFHARAGQEEAVEAALRDVLPPSREEPGCISIHAFRSIQDPGLFYIHSRWPDETAFEIHAGLPHTVRFLERMDALVDQPREVTRAQILD
jgi:quinol monooxygenase YgiN